MRFTYRSGERPLDGYTLKRGVGRGGFGEVYFAVSDGGKEVALKLLRGHTDVELRGVAHCLNLKHPNLVHVYDLKTDDHGDRWLVMEYVLGESMAQVLDRHPGGLPAHLAADWFQSLARAVGYLHDHGVVHRDLKPANIFVENGNLKVGDYGLCKTLSGSGRQTQTVGTVHYMAPEVSTGNYTKSIDIYACGVILHEMLTGKPPFDGETDGEVLMKHLTATPDLGPVPEPFKGVVGRALDKNPMKRFATLAEFARAVEAVRPGNPAVKPAPPAVAVPPVVTTKEPPPLPKPAEPAAAVVVPAVPVAARAPVLPPRGDTAGPVPFRGRVADLTGSMLKAPAVAALAVLPWALVTGTTEYAALGKMFVVTTAVTWAVLATAGGAGYRSTDTWPRRLRAAGLGLLVGLLAFWLDGYVGPDLDPPLTEETAGETYLGGAVRIRPETVRPLTGYLLYFGCALGACRWWRMAARDRKERFSLFPPVAAAFWGAVLMFLWPWSAGSPAAGIVPLVLAAVAVQWVSPWTPPPPAPPKRLRWRAAY